MEHFDWNAWERILLQAIETSVSDIHLVAGQPVFLRKHGLLQTQPDMVPEDSLLQSILAEMLSPEQKKHFESKRELDFSWTYLGRRFRINAYMQLGRTALALRLLPARILPLERLGCPVLLKRFAMLEHGLLLVAGKTGAGKTTTLASLLDFINHSRTAHIITLEDPVEYLHKSVDCLISQREFGTDFRSFSSALRSALREDPDIIFIGELRDRDTIQTALNAAETGHFVMGTLHTQNAEEAVMRIESMFPAEQQVQVRAQLAGVLAGIFSQRLLPAIDGSRVCAAELLLTTPAIRNLIRTGKVQQLSSHILSGLGAGMQTLELCVAELYSKKYITKEIAGTYQT